MSSATDLCGGTNEQAQRCDTCTRRSVDCPDCEMIMPADELDTHRAHECSRRLVKCKQCGQHVEDRFLKAHETSHCRKRICLCRLGCGARCRFDERTFHEVDKCPERVCTCEKCGEHLLAKDMPRHEHQLCPMRIIFCRCGARIAACDLERHEKKECPLRPLPCMFAHLGCKEVLGPPDRRRVHELHLCPKRPLACKLDCGHTCMAEDMPDHIENRCPSPISTVHGELWRSSARHGSGGPSEERRKRRVSKP